MFSKEYSSPARQPAALRGEVSERDLIQEFRNTNLEEVQEANITQASEIVQALDELSDDPGPSSSVEQAVLRRQLNTKSVTVTVLQLAQVIVRSSEKIKNFYRNEGASGPAINEKAFEFLKAINSSNRTYATGIILVAEKLDNPSSPEGQEIVELLLNAGRIANGNMDVVSANQSAQTMKNITLILRNGQASTAEEAWLINAGKSIHVNQPFAPGRPVWVDGVHGADGPMKAIVRDIHRKDNSATVELRPAPAGGDHVTLPLSQLRARDRYEKGDEVVMPDGRKGIIAQFGANGDVTVSTKEGLAKTKKTEYVQLKVTELDLLASEDIRSKLKDEVFIDGKIGTIQSYDPKTSLANVAFLYPKGHNLPNEKPVQVPLQSLNIEVFSLPLPDPAQRHVRYSDPGSYLYKFVWVDQPGVVGRYSKGVVTSVNASERRVDVELRPANSAGDHVVVPLSMVSLRDHYEKGDEVIVPDGRTALITKMFKDGTVLVSTKAGIMTGKVMYHKPSVDLTLKVTDLDTPASQNASRFLNKQVLYNGVEGLVQSFNPTTGLATVVLKAEKRRGTQGKVIEAPLKDLAL
jgi:hypothetical protein